MDTTNIKIIKEISNNTMNIKVEGSINFATSPDFEKAVLSDIDKINKIIVDCKNVPYISSTGLRVFLQAYKILNTPKSITVINANDELKEIFNITRFSDIINIQ